MYRIALKTACIVAVSLALISQSQAAPINQNLLTNAGFESSLAPPWGFAGTFVQGAHGPEPYAGDHYLAPNGRTTGMAYQTVDLEALGFDAHRLATGGYRARVEGYMYSGNAYSVGQIHLGEIHTDGSNNGVSSIAVSSGSSWQRGIRYVGLAPGTKSLTYQYTARSLDDQRLNQAYLDAASLRVSEYSIWTYGNVTDSIHTRDSRTTEGEYNIAETGSGQINITRNKTWTTTSTVNVADNLSTTGRVNIKSGSWQANSDVNLGRVGDATVTISNNGTWNVAGDVMMGLYSGNDVVSVNDGLWKTSGKVQIGKHGGECKVNIGNGGKWVSNGEVRTNDVDVAKHYAEINVNGGQWEANGKNYIGMTADGEYVDPVRASKVTVTNGGQWTTTAATYLGNTTQGIGEVNLNNGTWTSGTLNTPYGVTHVGEHGTGKVTLENGSNWTSNQDVHLGRQASGTGTVNLDSASTWTANDYVNIGYKGTGEINVGENSTFETTAQIVHIGRDTGSQGTVNINGGTWDDTANGVFVGDFGTGEVNITEGGTWNSNYTALGYGFGGGGGTVNLTDGTWNAHGSTYIGTSCQSTLRIGNAGIWNTQAWAGVAAGSKATIDGGTWNAQGSTSIGSQYSQGDVVILNNGQLNATGELTVHEHGTLRLESGNVHLAGDWDNQGEIKLPGGHLFIEHSGTLGNMELNGGKVSILGSSTVADAGGITVGSASTMILDQDGTVSIGSGQSLNVNNLIQMPNGDGTIQLNNGILTHAQNRLNLNGGRIEGRGQIFVGNNGLHLGTDGTIAGTAANKRLTVWGHVSGSGRLDNVTLYGNLNIGNSPGIIEADGLTLTSATTLEMELGGLLAGTEYDQLILDGLLTLDGTLDVTWYDNFEAIIGDSFTLFAMENGASIEGQFNEIRLPTFSDPSLSWDTSGLYTAGTISVVPEPSTLALLLAGGLAMIRRRK